MKPNTISASVIFAVAMLAPPAMAADAAHPTVVELFQSQGCSDCPPANANVMALNGRPDLLTLSFGVTYWDQLGWKDTFASPQYTARQWDYAHAFHRQNVFTPEVVVNGRADVVGANRAELESLIDRHAGDRGPDLHIAGDAVSVGKGDGAEIADVWLVRYDPNIVQVPIARGENGGRTLPHQNVVKALVKLGVWNGTQATYRIPADINAQWRVAVLVQAGTGGAFLRRRARMRNSLAQNRLARRHSVRKKFHHSEVPWPGQCGQPKGEFIMKRPIAITTLALFLGTSLAGAAFAQAQSSGAMSNGSMSNGSMSNGSMSNGKMADGKMSDGKMATKDKKKKDAMSNGSMSNGSMSSGSMSNGQQH